MTLWRNFKFFDTDTIKGALETLEITSACFGRNAIYFGDADGMVRAFDRSGKTELLAFQAYAGPVTHLKHLRTRNILVSLGDDDTMNPSILRVWDLDRRDSQAGGRPAQKEHRLFSSKYPAPQETIVLRTNYNKEIIAKLKFMGGATSDSSTAAARPALPLTDFRTVVVSFDVSEDLNHCAVGLTNGDVVVIKGDLERERSPKIRRMHSSMATGKLTFLGFPRAKLQQDGEGGGGGDGGVRGRSAAGGNSSNQQSSFAQLLFAVYEDVVTVWRVSHKADYTEYRCEPPIGGSYECSAINDEGQLVVGCATSNQLAFFGGDTFLHDMSTAWDPTNLRAVQWAEVEGDKKRILFHKNYVIVLTQHETRPDRFNLQAYDVENNIRGFTRQQESHVNVAWVLSDSSEVLVIEQEAKQETVMQKIFRLTEVDTQAKLEQLFTKECYDVAKKMAKRLQQGGGAGADAAAQQMNIQKKYGDHLYLKGKFSEAIDQYIEAIGQLEPSYVIRQFLDAQRIHHLTRYLEELHHKRHGNIANKNHTTLLLNCLTKLRDESKLNSFIRRDDIRFDAENAIKVCRQAGYYEAATYLADRYSKPSEYVKIQLEHLHQPTKALQFVRKLCVDDAEAILKEHGKELVLLVAEDATDTLIELCVEWKGPRRRIANANNNNNQQQDDNIAGSLSGTYASQQQQRARQTQGGNSGNANNSEQQGPRKPPKRAVAQEFIHVFVDSPLCLLRFLQSVVESGVLDGDADEDGQRIVYNTLLELYLTKELKRAIKHVDPSSSSSASNGSPSPPRMSNDASSSSHHHPQYQAEPHAQRLQRAMALLEAHRGKYDDYHALALVQQHHFEEGALFMLQQLNLYSEIFTHYAKIFENGSDLDSRMNAKTKLIMTCQEHRSPTGNDEAERELWISLLSLLVRSKDDTAQDITQVLEHIEKEDLLPPVAVIEIISQNKDLQLKSVREYILRMLRKDSEKVDKHQKEIRELNDKTNKIRNDLKELQTTAVVFQSNKCAHCNSLLDLPAVHFLCRHSYHQRCLNDVLECNVCAAENRKIIQIQRELDERVNNHEEFFRHMGDHSDGFSVVAEYFSRGIFAAPQLKKEAMLNGGPATFDDDGAAAAGNDDQHEFEEEDDAGLDFDDGQLANPEEVELW